MGRIRSLIARLYLTPDQEPLGEPTFAPLRGELLSAAQLDIHAYILAADHRDIVVRMIGGDPLRAALDRHERQIAVAHQRLGDDLRQRKQISPAAEWLIDNFHVVNAQIRAIRHDLPPGYYRQLPKLRVGPFAGLPRIYAVALDLISHTDGRVDPEMLLRFLNAYQSVTPLRMGEL